MSKHEKNAPHYFLEGQMHQFCIHLFYFHFHTTDLLNETEHTFGTIYTYTYMLIFNFVLDHFSSAVHNATLIAFK